MIFERTPETDRKYAVKFDQRETEVLVAAYRERIFRAAMDGELEQIEDYEINIAGYDKPCLTLRLDEAIMISVLTDFSAQTRDSIAAIPSESRTPAYANTHIGKRYELGKRAVVLANEISNEIVADEFCDGITDFPEIG